MYLSLCYPSRSLLLLYLFISVLGVSACSSHSSNPERDGVPDRIVETQQNDDAEDEENPSEQEATPSSQGRCAPLPAASGNTIIVSSADVIELQSAVVSAVTGDTILLEDGTYDLNGVYLWFSVPGVTLRSLSGNPEAVVLDGGYTTTEIITVAASDVTIAEISIVQPFTHAIHVTSSNLGDTLNTLIYRINIRDPREQAIKINPHSGGGVYSDDGVIACSTMLLTDQGRPNVNPYAGGCYTGGVDAHQAKGWTIRDNHIEGFWCNTGLAEHAIHLWRGSRDTIVERNTLIDNGRGVGFGLSSSGTARTFNDTCSSVTVEYVGHYDGIVRNNFIFAGSQSLLNSPSGFDCGVCLASACGAKVLHNTIVSTGENFSSIEWRFAGSQGIEIVNNIVTHSLRARNGGSATLESNLQDAALSLFEGISTGNLHLVETATDAIDQGAVLQAVMINGDIDQDDRVGLPDIGADEY